METCCILFGVVVSEVYTFVKNIKWNKSMEFVLFYLVSGKFRHLDASPGSSQNIVWIPYNHLLLVSRFFVYFVSQQTLIIISSSFIKKKTSRNYTVVVSMKELLKFPSISEFSPSKIPCVRIIWLISLQGKYWSGFLK